MSFNHETWKEEVKNETQRQGSKLLICIEGNIGAGKSTLTLELAELLDAKPFFEPVTENPYLNRFYQDPKRYALEMQFWLMSRRFEMHEEAIEHIWRTGQTVLMDRSIYGDWVFAKQNWINGNIDDVGFEAYCHHREVMNKRLLPPHLMLFLNVPPEICVQRILKRGRNCEKEIPLEYLQGLDILHHKLATEMVIRGSKVRTLDWQNTSPFEVCALADQIVTGAL